MKTKRIDCTKNKETEYNNKIITILILIIITILIIIILTIMILINKII
jgi:hypothetical protein